MERDGRSGVELLSVGGSGWREAHSMVVLGHYCFGEYAHEGFMKSSLGRRLKVFGKDFGAWVGQRPSAASFPAVGHSGLGEVLEMLL